jgi:hypothetical protein
MLVFSEPKIFFHRECLLDLMPDCLLFVLLCFLLFYPRVLCDAYSAFFTRTTLHTAPTNINPLSSHTHTLSLVTLPPSLPLVPQQHRFTYFLHFETESVIFDVLSDLIPPCFDYLILIVLVI